MTIISNSLTSCNRLIETINSMQIKIFSIENDRFDELHAISKLWVSILYDNLPYMKTKNKEVLANGNLRLILHILEYNWILIEIYKNDCNKINFIKSSSILIQCDNSDSYEVIKYLLDK